MTVPIHKIGLRPGPGFRIRSAIERPEPALVARFEAYASQDVSDQLNGMYALAPEIRSLVAGGRLVGPACTVRVPPHDNLMLHKALDVARPGDVLVVDAGGAARHAICGDIICQKAKHRGIAGLVIDGWVRDLPGLQALGLPVFARGVTPIAPHQYGPGEINYPVSCGGIVVAPGDLILADVNGVVAVPRAELAELLEHLDRWEAGFRGYQAEVQAGRFDNAWVDRLLGSAGLDLGL